MAKNTYKAKSKKEKKSFKLPTVNIKFLDDRRFQLTAGLLILVSSLFLTTAFISYIFTGQLDQSIVTTTEDISLQDAGLEAENWLGLFGAIIAHHFMFQYFGIASFLIPPFLFLIGFKIVFKKEILSISKSFVFTLFFLLWISLFLGYLMVNSDTINLGYVGGGIGFEFATFIDSLFGWGTVLILGLSLIVFIIFFFNITNLLGIEGISFQKNEDSEDDILNDNASESDAIAAVVEQIKEEVAQEELEALNTEEIKEEEWEVETLIKPKKLKEKPELELDVEIPEPDDIVVEEDVELEVKAPVEEKRTDSLENYDPTLDLGHYQYPTPGLLDDYPEKDIKVSKESIEISKFTKPENARFVN